MPNNKVSCLAAHATTARRRVYPLPPPPPQSSSSSVGATFAFSPAGTSRPLLRLRAWLPSGESVSAGRRSTTLIDTEIAILTARAERQHSACIRAGSAVHTHA